MDRDCDTCKHEHVSGRCTAPTPGDCLPQDGRPLWEEFTDDEPWTACEECANACGGGDDFLECGLDLGAPYGGGVTFICDSFKQAPPQPACPECKGLGYIGDAATTILGNGAVVVADGEQCRACEGTGCIPSGFSANTNPKGE